MSTQTSRQSYAAAMLRSAESDLEQALQEEYHAHTAYERSRDRYDLARLRAARRQIERANAKIDRARNVVASAATWAEATGAR